MMFLHWTEDGEFKREAGDGGGDGVEKMVQRASNDCEVSKSGADM